MVVDMRGIHTKWQRLVEVLRNTSTASVFRIVCEDAKRADHVRRRISYMVETQPDQGIPMFVVMRGNDIYVIKVNQAKKVVLISD
jgi:hypothetical protein